MCNSDIGKHKGWKSRCFILHIYSMKGVEEETLKAKSCSNKTEDEAKQHSAFWETISTCNKSLLVIYATNIYFSPRKLYLRMSEALTNMYTQQIYFSPVFAELLCKEFLQYSPFCSVCYLCNQLHPSLL